MRLIILQTIVLLVITNLSYGQTNISSLSHQEWIEDLDTLVAKGRDIFAGFTPETRALFDKEADAIRKAIPDLSSASIALAFTRLLALLKDGHTEVSFRTPQFLYLPLRLYYYDDDLFITGTSRDYESLLGAKVLSFDALPVAQVFEKLKPYINADNEMEYLLTAPTFMTIPKVLEEIGVSADKDSVKITVQSDDGTTRQEAIKKLTLTELRSAGRPLSVQEKQPLYLKDRQKWYWYEYLPESEVMFVKIGAVSNQRGELSLQQFFEELFVAIDQEKPQELVIDFRLCRGGNYHRAMPLIEGIRARPFINKKGKIYIVHSRLTFSAGATASLFLKDNTEALIIGETSRARPNHSDNAEFFNLPNSGLGYGFTNRLGIHSPGLGQTDRIPVDIPITPSFELFKAGRDEVLEYIIGAK